jgi:HD-GYP domain-containing protein (c-di-GMP phosphodiesterase class II)
MVGRALGFDASRMNQLAAGCLLHDVGKVFVEPGGSPAEDIVRHTVLGYELLRNSEEADLLSPFVAYEHHEHQDGTGLPRGLRSSNEVRRRRGHGGAVPTLIGEVCAVADTYDNLLSGAGGALPMTPDKALHAIGLGAGERFNYEVVHAFRSVVPVYPRGCQVRLRGGPFDGCLGVVAQVNAKHLAHPMVILARNARGERITPRQMDLREHRDVLLETVAL